jgi:hypothetical protein
MGGADHKWVKVPGDARDKPPDLPIGDYKELPNRRGYYLGRVFFWFKTDVRTFDNVTSVSFRQQ